MPTVNEPIVVTYEGGLRFEAQVRSHRIVMDQPERVGGDDAGPQPVELLGAALGGCAALYVQRFLHTRDLPSEGLRVEVEQHGATNPSRVAGFVVRIVLPVALSETHAEILERVVRSCPVHNTITEGALVSVRIETDVESLVG